jgi:bleomycin hydrolase
MGSAPSKPVEHVKAEGISEKREDMPLPLVSYAPVSVDGSLSLKSVSDWEAAASASAKTRLARAVLSHSDLKSALVRREPFVADVHIFNTELDFKTGPVTNQKSSGRCWLFATTNVLRYEIMKKLNLKEFQLSQARTITWIQLRVLKDSLQSYLFFWDKLNKANYYLELSIQEAGRPLDDRLISHLAGDLISDGGQWDMVVNLLEVTNDAILWDYCVLTEMFFDRIMASFLSLFTPNPLTRRHLGL